MEEIFLIERIGLSASPLPLGWVPTEQDAIKQTEGRESLRYRKLKKWKPTSKKETGADGMETQGQSG